MALAGGGTYLYLDYAAHFESTDDAFIAARQFSVAPQVAGYITAVPVTDNEHVAAGQVIARIDVAIFASRSPRPRRKSPPHRRAWRRRRADRSAAGADRRGPGAGDPGAGGTWCSPVSWRTLRALVRAGREQCSTTSSRRPSSTSSARSRRRGGDGEAGREAGRDAESPARLRRGEPRSGSGPTRPGPVEPLLYRRHGELRPDASSTSARPSASWRSPDRR